MVKFESLKNKVNKEQKNELKKLPPVYSRDKFFSFLDPSTNMFAQFLPFLGIALKYAVPDLTSNFICALYTDHFGLGELVLSLKLLYKQGTINFFIFYPIKIESGSIIILMYIESFSQFRVNTFLNKIGSSGLNTYRHLSIMISPRPRKAIARDVLEHIQCIVKGLKPEQFVHCGFYYGKSRQKNLNVRDLIDAVELGDTFPASFEKIISPEK